MRHLIYSGRINEIGVQNTMILLNESMKNGESAAILHIASLGGDVTSGMLLYNFIRMLPIEIRTHAVSTCHSIAASILLGGTIRTAAPASNFLVHAPRYSEGDLIGKLSPNGQLVAQPFSAIAGWSEEDIKARFETDGEFLMTPEKAVALNVISEVVDLQFAHGDEVITVRVD